MKASKQLDKWAAEKCGVEMLPYKRGDGYKCHRLHINGELINFLNEWNEWTLSDARCREIVRERFKLETLLGNRSKNLNSCTWICEYLSDEDGHLICGGRGYTIEAAEIACITAIMEAE